MAKVKFVQCTYEKFQGAAKDDSTLYFVSDIVGGSGNYKLFKGTTEVTHFAEDDAVQLITRDKIVENKDGKANTLYICLDPSDPVANSNGKLYCWNTNTFVQLDTDETTINTLINQAITTAGLDDVPSRLTEAENTIQTIQTSNPIIGLTYDSTTGTISTTGVTGPSTANVALTGVAHDVTYDSSTLTLTIPMVGTDTALTINLPKDNFVKSGRYEAEYDLPDSPEKGPAIVLVVGDDSSTKSEVVIPAKSLVDIYTGGNTNNVKVSVSDAKEITADVVIDPAADNALTSSKAGLKVDLSSINAAIEWQTIE